MTGGTRPDLTVGLLLIVILVAFSAGCGIVGPLVPPESIGVAAQQAREKEREAKAAEERKKVPAESKPVPTEQAPTPEEEEEEEPMLPGLRSVGVP